MSKCRYLFLIFIISCASNSDSAIDIVTTSSSSSTTTTITDNVSTTTSSSTSTTVVTYDGCIPENNENGANLYQILRADKDGNALKSVFARHLLDGYCIDPTHIRLNDYDYLFVTRIDEPGITLHLFYCRDITKDELVMHPSSPLCVDHSLGRSAGRILVESEEQSTIIRPSQIMKTDYGEGILFSRYKLNENQCKLLGVQKKIKSPRKSVYSNLHHIDYLGGITAIDYIKH